MLLVIPAQAGIQRSRTAFRAALDARQSGGRWQRRKKVLSTDGADDADEKSK
jgi:hypothetical protein